MPRGLNLIRSTKKPLQDDRRIILQERCADLGRGLRSVSTQRRNKILKHLAETVYPHVGHSGLDVDLRIDQVFELADDILVVID
jgi:hypothetical protein